MRATIGAVVGLALLAGCAAPVAPRPEVAALARVPGENLPGADAFARDLLEGLQRRSFLEHREFCGYLVRTPSGQVGATPPRGGDLAGCEMGQPPVNAFASYHTHGAYDAGYDNEVPSAPDLESDFGFRHDGYVSTPGGRFWRVEYDARAAFLLCGQGCLSADSRFVVDPADAATIRSRMSLDVIRARNYGPAGGPSGRVVSGL